MKRTDLESEGFVFPEKPDAPTRRSDAARAFAGWWDDLPTDPYMRGGALYRERRYARFAVALDAPPERLPHRPFIQSREINPYAGDTARDFAPMRDETANSPILHSLLARDASRLNPERLGGVDVWHVDVHQVRTIAEPDAPGDPAPEGPHRDGMTAVAVHLIRRENMTGGETRICTTDLETLERRTLTHPFDSFMILDEKLLHDATPVATTASATRGVRDTLLFGFRPYTPELDEAGYTYVGETAPRA